MRFKKLLFCISIFVLYHLGNVFLAVSGETIEPSAVETSDTTTMFNHPDDSWYWLSGQQNVIFQGHPSFHANYSGANSLRTRTEHAASMVATLYSGAQVSKTTEILFDVETAGGKGISKALGLAGFSNLDVVRNPSLGADPYVARVMLRQIVPLSDETVKTARNVFSLATELPVRRLEFRFGKMSTVDFFDVNSIGSDSHLQFMNWTVDNNGAYDYAADTRGYTYGALMEYQDRNWGLRFGEMLMPTVANGINLDWHLSRARAENVEMEIRHSLIADRNGTIRLLSYVNHANMGSYRDAINAFLTGQDPQPDITAHRRQRRVKYGFGLNAEQEITSELRLFGRLSWNEGRNESYAYTEVNNAVAIGADFKGIPWNRKLDKVGVAFVSNGLSSEHRKYLALGGQGFLLGDGRLSYGRERIVEAYYNAHVWRGLFAAFDLQHITHPGYNRDRGPVVVPSLRFHIDF
jgi:high affinity Mn2+ porin